MNLIAWLRDYLASWHPDPEQMVIWKLRHGYIDVSVGVRTIAVVRFRNERFDVEIERAYALSGHSAPEWRWIDVASFRFHSDSADVTDELRQIGDFAVDESIRRGCFGPTAHQRQELLQRLSKPVDSLPPKAALSRAKMNVDDSRGLIRMTGDDTESQRTTA